MADRSPHVQSTSGRLERPRAVDTFRLAGRLLVPELPNRQIAYLLWPQQKWPMGLARWRFRCVLYLGSDEYCAFMESIGRGALKTRFVPGSQLKATGLAKIGFKAALRLIDMVRSGGLIRLGAESSLTSGSGYKNSQRWSRALRQHPSKPDGIYYRSRHDSARTAAALFDHCERSLQVVEILGAWADQTALLGEILDHYALGTDL